VRKWKGRPDKTHIPACYDEPYLPDAGKKEKGKKEKRTKGRCANFASTFLPHGNMIWCQTKKKKKRGAPVR